MSDAEYPWEQPLGAVPHDDGTVEFRVWALRPERVAVRIGGADHELRDEGYGIHSARVPARAGDDYEYVLDGRALPDPGSRWQPGGLRGPSRVVDPGAFPWTDAGWDGGAPLRDAVIYELHVGTFTAEGTFDAAIGHLSELARLGVTHIELMPVAEFPGARGWGYDGVYISAAQSSYGGPLGLQRLVDAAHAAGLGVILDVVYNHLGASGVQAIEAYGPYFTEKYSTFWGKALNYDDADSDPVREWVLQSAAGWVRDFHVDGLRLDAIHAIYDQSARHLLAELAERVHGVSGHALVISESGLNDPKVIRPQSAGGFGHDAQWADDFHHALRVLLTGDRAGYYEEFGDVAQLAKAWRRPFVHDGDYSTFRRRRFGAPAGDCPPEQFIVFDQNHDQVGNRAFGDRMPAEARPLAAFCTLLSPFVPMLFMGEEYGEPAPFQFFTDHIDEEIAIATREGRRREFSAFAEFSGEEVPDPQGEATFAASKLTRAAEAPVRDLYARLLRARRELRLGGHDAEAVDHGEDVPWLRARAGSHTIACNFAAEPASVPVGEGLEIVLSTADARLDGGEVHLPARAGALLRSTR
ncbi:MAG: maltooligosyltrehalose trehalohydrolase [Solirubrobacteraceae bacterium]|nr:maltooligosyltrehalose trehalohydrolase [Solirubrobacteraceae bacterium]